MMSNVAFAEEVPAARTILAVSQTGQRAAFRELTHALRPVMAEVGPAAKFGTFFIVIFEQRLLGFGDPFLVLLVFLLQCVCGLVAGWRVRQMVDDMGPVKNETTPGTFGPMFLAGVNSAVVVLARAN